MKKTLRVATLFRFFVEDKKNDLEPEPKKYVRKWKRMCSYHPVYFDSLLRNTLFFMYDN